MCARGFKRNHAVIIPLEERDVAGIADEAEAQLDRAEVAIHQAFFKTRRCDLSGAVEPLAGSVQ